MYTLSWNRTRKMKKDNALKYCKKIRKLLEHISDWEIDFVYYLIFMNIENYKF